MSGSVHSGDAIVGGVRRVAFAMAEHIDNIIYDYDHRSFSNIVMKQNHSWSVIIPKENEAHFTQTSDENNPDLWKMSLDFSVNCPNGSQIRLTRELNKLAKSGGVIVVELNNNAKIVMGYSVTAKFRVPIVLSKAVMSTGSSAMRSAMRLCCNLSWCDISPARGVVNVLF